MKKTRKAHLWIGLICSIFILMESITGLLMNEPWLIGQSTMEGNRGNFQPGRMVSWQHDSSIGSNQQDQAGGQQQGQSSSQPNASGQAQQSQTGTNSNEQFPGQGGPGVGGPGVRGPGGEGMSQGSFMSMIKGLHEGRIGTTNIKWLLDLTAVALIFLTSSGIFLSLKVLLADRKSKLRRVSGEIA